MRTRLIVGETFRTKGGLELYVEERNRFLYTCVHRGTNWRGYFFSDGEYNGPVAPPDPNLNADFFVK